jgi:hypothetical protein
MKTESSDLDTAPSQGTAPTAKQRPSELRVALLTLVLPLYVSVGFAANYIGALHSPSPHDVKVAVVGAPAATAPLAHALTVKARGGLNVSQLSTVAPLPADNSSGTPNFFFLIICTLGTFLTVVALGFLAPTLPEPQRIAIVAAASVLAPLIAYLIGGAGYHTFSGDFGTVMAMLGMGALYAFAVACITRLLQLGLGPLGALVASALLIFLDLPSSGGSVAPPADAWLLALSQPLLDRGRRSRRQPKRPLLPRCRRRDRRTQDPGLGSRLGGTARGPDLLTKQAPEFRQNRGACRGSLIAAQSRAVAIDRRATTGKRVSRSPANPAEDSATA